MIAGIKLIDLQVYTDDRGALTQVYELSREIPEIKRMYIVSNFDVKTIRAYHKNIGETKCFFVVRGAVKFVLVDDRQDSKTYKDQQTVILNEKKPQLLVVPAGVYNGWKSLEEKTLLLGTADSLLSVHKDERVPPESFGDVWTTKNR